VGARKPRKVPETVREFLTEPGSFADLDLPAGRLEGAQPDPPPVADPRSFAGPTVDSVAPGLYLCDPGDGRPVERLERWEAESLLRTSFAMIRLRDERGGWTPWSPW
jgi:hypothetical protein